MEQAQEKSPPVPRGQGTKDDLVSKFMSVAQGPDGDLLLNLLDVLYDRMSYSTYWSHIDFPFTGVDCFSMLKRYYTPAFASEPSSLIEESPCLSQSPA